MPGVPNESRPPPVNRVTPNRDAYWFAHGGVDEVATVNTRNNSRNADSKDAQLQKEREERIKAFQEQREEERLKRLLKLQETFELARKQRELQEEERRRKIEEAKIKESERRQQVEERKRQIWEAEQERKSAILRRNLEREARIEARRNAQRNSASFAFGSSTPRTFDLDLAALGRSGCPLMSSVSGRRSEEREFGAKRATSACSLDRKTGEDCMSWSMTSLSSSSRGRRRTDLTPTFVPRERSMTPHSTPRGNPSMRAVSMTRLDQLAQPRRRYYDASRDMSSSVTSTATTSPSGPRASSPSMSKSMCNLANNASYYQPFRRLTRASPAKGGPSMSRSMMHLPGSVTRNNQRIAATAVSPTGESNLNKLRPAQSMSHLAIAPRLTRAARLRANALTSARQDGHTKSMMNLHKNEGYAFGRLTLSAKDTSCSPSRPQSAMSGKSEMSVSSSQASGLAYRPRPIAPRKPRPVSIAGTTVEKPTWNSSYERQSRSHDQNATVPKTTPRARSKEPETKPKPPPKKPVPPPKSAQVLAKARSHPVPTKDNLRRVKSTDSSNKVSSSDNSESSENVPVSEPKHQTAADSNVIKSLPEVSAQTSMSSGPSASASPKEDVPSMKPEVSSSPPVNAKQELDSAQVEQSEVNVESTSAEGSPPQESSPTKPRITSEEEAKALLAEKRRIAREQAEREAELERQRQEELRRQEEERIRQEELEQKRQEEEQIRLAELHRKLEEEKLRKAIEEKEQKEREEQARREEEARLKAEKEEQEKKAREEAMKQRLELEEKLRKEEQERAERKRRVEQIMSRTRIRGSQSADALSGGNKQTDSVTASQSFIEAKKTSDLNVIPSSVVTSLTSVEASGTSVMKSIHLGDSVTTVTQSSSQQSSDQQTAEQFDLDSVISSGIKNGFGANGDINQSDMKTASVSNDVNSVPNRTSDAAAVHTNGYTSHGDSNLKISSEGRSDKSDSCESVLVNVQSPNSVVRESCVETSSQLIDLGMGDTTTVSHNNNYMFNVDIVNSNVNAADPFHAMGDSLLKKQENAITDLLS